MLVVIRLGYVHFKYIRIYPFNCFDTLYELTYISIFAICLTIIESFYDIQQRQ